MRQRAIEHRGIGEPIADALFENGGARWRRRGSLLRCRREQSGSGELVAGGRLVAQLCCGGIGFAAAAHRTSVNSRSQRTVHGQRQISQAWVSSLIEKKMICALPIRFSNGT